MNSCQPSENCLAAFLAAAEPFTYLHCMGNTGGEHGVPDPETVDDLLGKTTFAEMDFRLGAPHGKAVEGPQNMWTRKFGDARQPTVVSWDNAKASGSIKWAHMHEE